jgi:hypothetical protein
VIAAGAALGSQYAVVERNSRFLNYAVHAGLVLPLGSLVVRAVRRGRQSRSRARSS